MLSLLRRAFGYEPEPVPLHISLINEAEKTGDNSRLMAQIIVDWAWDSYKKMPNIAPALEFVEHIEEAGYKAAGALSQEERKALSPRQLLISEALQDIQTRGFLETRMGHTLRHFAESGEIVPVVVPQSEGLMPA